MKAEATQVDSQRSVNEALKKALQRTGENPRESRDTRTLVLEVEDASIVVPLCGSHRIQRIPKGSSARHTSTATIVVVDENLSEFVLTEGDLEERFARGSGPGGQHRNKTDSCVVLTHIPTGVSVRIDGRSQWQNRQDARRELARRLSEECDRLAKTEQNRDRQSQATSDRAAKTFTHNTQRDEVVDHQTGRRWRLSDFNRGKF